MLKEGPSPQAKEKMAKVELAQWRGRRAALDAGTVLAALALVLGGVVLLAAADGPAASPADPAAASSSDINAGPGRSLPAVVWTPMPMPGRGEEPPAAAVELDDPAAVGGDQPIGPQAPPLSGNIPENAGVSRQFLALRDTLASEIDTYRGRVGDIEVAVAVTDIQTGQTISVNGNAVQRTGCTINMFALLAVVGEFEAGRASPYDVAYNIKVGVGGSYPPEVRRFLQTVFGDHETGVARAREMMRSWGMQASLFDHVPYYGDDIQNNLLTALETNSVLAKLYRGQLFSPAWTAYTLERLRDIKWGLNYMLPGLLPDSATVAHKIGYYWDWDGFVNNDAGIVTFTGADGREKAYAITYLSQKARTEYTGYSFGAGLSRIVWDWFEARYVLGTAPLPPPPPPAPPPEPEPVPEPSPTATLEPTPSPVPSPSPEPVPSATPEPSPGPTPRP